MKGNLKNKKYLISSGCSYGKVISSLADEKFNKYLDIEDDVVMIDLAKESQSSAYSADSIIYCVNLLLTEGVDSKNIFVLNEWTTYDRTHDVFPSGVSADFESLNGNNPLISYEHELSGMFADRKNQVKDTEINSLLNLKKIKWKKNSNELPISIIDNLFYIASNNIDPDEYEGTPFDVWTSMLQKAHRLLTNETLMISYINNIIRLQNFLKLNKIKYKFHTINSQFSNWGLSEFGHIEWNIEAPYIVKNSFNVHNKIFMRKQKRIPTLKFNENVLDNTENHREHINSLNESNDIFNAFKGCKSKFNEIDLSNFWFYEKNNYRFGGIDEYTIDNFSHYGYCSPQNIEKDEFTFQIPNYGNHPEIPVYFLLAEELLEECEFVNMKPNTREDVLSKIKEDLESDKSINSYFKSNLEFKNMLYKSLI